MNKWTISGTQAWNEDHTVKVRGWYDDEGYITETIDRDRVEGYGVYHADGEGVLMHVQDFATFEGALGYAQILDELSERRIV